MAKKYIAFFIILLGFLLTQLNFSAYLPTLPTLATVFNSSNQAMMLTLSIIFIGYAIGQLVWGTLSDYIGRRRVVLLALIGYAIMISLVALSHHYITFCLSYILAGFMAAAFTSVGNAMVRDLFVEPAAVTRAISTIGIFMAAGPLIGPFVGAHLAHHFQWQAIFIFLAIFAVILLVAMFALVAETQQQTNEKKHHPLSVYKMLLTNLRYTGYILILGIMFGTMFSLLDAVPFLYKHSLKLDLLQSGRLMALTIVGLIAGTIIVWLLVKRIGTKNLTATGIFLALVGGGWLMTAAEHGHNTVLSVTLPLILSCFGFGFIIPSTKGGAMTALEQHAGCAASMMKFTQSVLSIIIISIFSYWHSGLSLMPMAIMVTATSVICVIIFTFTLAKTE
ncbi:MAG: multidrug effflux MFS transporter [Gammaproteobacteria bacterium]|nr:multidrug effflux MFS transporter [Gammaproteobacteria bacterium]MCP4475103.1 multidrug effflux MFS transporter [Gammaproteobacteria bacterium]